MLTDAERFMGYFKISCVHINTLYKDSEHVWKQNLGQVAEVQSGYKSVTTETELHGHKSKATQTEDPSQEHILYLCALHKCTVLIIGESTTRTRNLTSHWTEQQQL